MERSILVVGHLAFRQMLTAQLQAFGDSSVIEADSASQAGMMLQTASPDLMIIQADDLNQVKACLHLPGRTSFQWVYSLLVTGLPSCGHEGPAVITQPDEHQAACLELGADAYLRLQSSTTGIPPSSQRLLQAQIQVGRVSAQRHQELLKTNDLLSTIALVDPLTELNNRRALDWDLPRQIKLSREGDRPLGLLIFDLDFFKRINDTYGHLVGDVSLKLLSARLRHNLRANDTLFRYGGEEFVVLLSDTSKGEASEIAQRLCNMIGHQSFTINDDLELSLTVSVGVSDLNDTDDAQGISLLERADHRLRQAKQTGRNRVVTY